jgi:hypothetical protein
MTYLVTADYQLNQIVAPRLPNATLEYDPRYIDQLNNILRLYFNQIDDAFGRLKVSSIDSGNVQTQIWLGNSGGLFSG